MFRLAINVSVTRLILTKGDAGSVVHDFGQFVVGGNVVIGLVIFLILIVIQFVVVTNGAGRVAEVAARFTLDAMPGKQMAIDADLNAGLITDEQARKRRQEIAREADFYGAMDGASKFVKGDAMAAVIITAINLIGGIVVGVVQHHIGFSEATHTYSMLTVGDGLAAQIPALLISVATGILVTRSALGEGPRLGPRQPDPAPAQGAAGGRRASSARSRWSRACRSCRSCSSAGSWSRSAGPCATACPTSSPPRPPPPRSRPPSEADKPSAPREEVLKELPIDPLELGIGFGLVPLVDRRTGGSLVRRVSMIRRQIAARARHGDPAGPDPRRGRPRFARVRGQGARHGRGPRHDHGRPSPGDGSGRRGRDAARHPDHRARLRAAGDLDSRDPARRGRGPRLHRGRRRIGDRHPPHRDDPQPRRPPAHAARRTPAPRSAKGNQRSCRYGGCARCSLARRDPACVAVAPLGGRVDPRPRRDRRVRRRQGTDHPRPQPAGRVRAPGARAARSPRRIWTRCRPCA